MNLQGKDLLAGHMIHQSSEVNAISQHFGVVREKEIWVRLGEFDFGATETRWN